MKIKPKYIKRANLWLVSEISKSADKKQLQKMNWFETEDQAINFYKE